MSSKYLVPHRDGAGWMVLVIASVLFAFAKYIILGLLVSLAIWCIYLAARKFTEIKHQKRVAERELRWRAEDQHMSYLRGEAYGTYGNYPPAESAFVKVHGDYGAEVGDW